MSTSETMAPPLPENPVPATARMRLWPLVLVVCAYWIYTEATYQIEFSQTGRFVARLIPLALLLLSFAGWWLTNRNYRWRDRLLVVGIIAAGMGIATLAADPSLNAFAMVLVAFPLIFTGGLVWLLISRTRSLPVQRLGFAAVVIAVFGWMSLTRWEGLDGRQQSTYAWRWTPTAEEEYLSAIKLNKSSGAMNSARTVALQPGDWVGFRGGDREGTVLVAPLGDWKASPPQLAWKQRIGPAWSSFAIVDGMAISQEQRGEDEAVVSYDVATGKELWAHIDKARFDEPLSGAGPRGTPAFCDGRLYSMGGKGRLNCLNAADGTVLWSKDIPAETGGTIPNFGASTSPVVVDHMIVVYAGGKNGQGLLALDAVTGQKVWAAEAGTESFSSPQLATLHGVRQIIMHDNAGLFGVSVDDGRRLWFQPGESALFVPMLQPHVLDHGDLIVGSDGGIVRLGIEKDGDQWRIGPRWNSNRLKAGFNEYVIHKDHIYGLDDGIFCCLDAATGKRLWKKGRYGFGQLLLLPEQERIIVLCESGEVVLVTTNPKELEEVAKFPAIQGKTWNHPVLAHGKLFVRNAEEMACFELAP